MTGLPYPLGAFKNQRSFLFVENLGFIVQQFIQNTYAPGTYHLADDKSLSTAELVKLMARILGRNTSVWKIPKGLMGAGATVGTWFRLPFNNNAILKLTESLVISNQKVLRVIGKPLPFGIEDGLKTSLRSHHE